MPGLNLSPKFEPGNWEAEAAMGMAQGLRREQRIIDREIRRQLEHTLFSDGGYRLHERKDFQVKAQTVVTQPLDETAEKPGRGRIGFAALFCIFLMLPGLPLLIIGSISTAEDRLAMLIPGAILTSIGGFTLLVSISAVIRWGRGKAARP